MKTFIKTALPLSMIIMLSGCATGWQATNHYDEFTDTKTCRIENGTQGERDFARGFTGIWFTQYFYAENHDGEIRAGVRTDPPLPIAGDIQIKVDDKLYTLTSIDAPVDVAPSITTDASAAEKALGKEYAATMESIIKNSQQMASPYRAYTGKKAIQLLRDVAHSTSEVKFRVVGVNTALSGTGSFTSGPDFVTALQKCGINL